MADKYVKDLSQTTEQLADTDMVIVEKADGSGTKIMQFSDLVASVTSKILKNNGTTTATGYALDARYGKTLKDTVDVIQGGRIGATDLSSTPLETLVMAQDAKIPYFYTCSSSSAATAAVMPSGISYGLITGVKISSSLAVMVLYPIVSSVGAQTIYVKFCTGGTWGSWRRSGASDIYSISLTGNGTKLTLNVPSGSRHVIVLHSNTSNGWGIYYIYSPSSGNVSVTEIAKGSSITSATAGTNKVEFATSTQSWSAYCMRLTGTDLS